MRSTSKKSPLSYNVGLGKKFLLRTGLILTGFLAIFISLISVGVYQGIKTGQLEQKIFKPLREFAELFQVSYSAQVEYKPGIDSVFDDVTYGSPSGQQNTSPSPVARQTQRPATGSTGNTYEDAKKAQDEWFRKVQEENQKTSQQWQAEYDQFVKDSNQRYEDFKKQSEQNYQNFKNQ